MNFRKGAFSARNVAILGVLTALIIVFQLLLAPLLNFGGTSFSLVLVPIVLGSILIAPWAGAFLGFVFSTIVFLCGLFGMDAFTQLMIQTNWYITVSIIYLKGVLAGLVPGYVFKWLKDKDQHAAVLVSGVTAPVINTGIFIIGTLLSQSIFFASYADFTETVFSSIIMINFLVELAINIVANPAIYTVVNVMEKKKG